MHSSELDSILGTPAHTPSKIIHKITKSWITNRYFLNVTPGTEDLYN